VNDESRRLRVQTQAHSTNGVTRAPASKVLERLAELQIENEQLQTALRTRIVVEQAKGAISVRCNVPVDIAFALLRGHARRNHRPIHEVAAEIVENGGRFHLA
jgi:AmiR/NasT family two-component response regulator